MNIGATLTMVRVVGWMCSAMTVDGSNSLAFWLYMC